MAKKPRYWTCQRQAGGIRCRRVNPAIKRNCQACGKPRPKRRQPVHRKALEVPYEQWVELFGERCGICGAEPPPGKKLRRDHDHRTGEPRGLLCYRDNKFVPYWVDVDWALNLARYLDPEGVPPL